MSDELLEPLKAYKNVYKEKIIEAAGEFFDNLVAKSEISVESNRQTIARLNKLKKEKASLEKKLSSLRAKRNALVIFGIIFVVGIIIPIFLMVKAMIPIWVGILICVGLVALGVFMIVVGFRMNGSIKLLKDKLEALNKQIAACIQEATLQMAPFNNLLDWNMHIKVINSVIPVVHLDEYLDFGKHDKLVNCYNFEKDSGEDYSAVYIQSGSVLGNPFLIRKCRVHRMIDKVYTGSIVISWVETYRDSKGNVHTRTRTQTLTATTTHPAPEYNEETVLIYGNAAAPLLVFSRKPQNQNGKSDKEIDRFVRHETKEIEKLAEKSVLKGGTFTPIGNNKFEALLHAYNRNHEQQFRLLFTPLAQKNFEELVTKNDEGFGDDFYFFKDKMINTISSRHSQIFDYSAKPSRFISYDHDAARQLFIDYVSEFFRNFYFDMAPLLSIPLYQQMKSLDYIYGDDAPANFSLYEHEVMANSFDQELFRPENTITDCILKTSIIRKDGRADKINVNAYAYRGEPRIDYKKVMGGDGHLHTVPIHWTEYFREDKTTVMELARTGSTLVDFQQKIKDNYLNKYFNEVNGQKPYSYQRGLVAFFPLGFFSDKEDLEIGHCFSREDDNK